MTELESLQQRLADAAQINDDLASQIALLQQGAESAVQYQARALDKAPQGPRDADQPEGNVMLEWYTSVETLRELQDALLAYRKGPREEREALARIAGSWSGEDRRTIAEQALRAESKKEGATMTDNTRDAYAEGMEAVHSGKTAAQHNG